MIVDKSASPDDFRAAVRQWLSEIAADIRPLVGLRGKTDEYVQAQKTWMAIRHNAGLATPHWPVEYGGQGLSLRHQVILADEIARFGAPDSDLFIVSLNHFPATLLGCGTEQQKRQYLPGVARGAVWCQGFSEPGAGSDLASLRTRAELDGDHYVVNGHKIWSSFSMYADFCILLTRTDPDARKHNGITFFLLDMKTPGVEVRPIRKSTGETEFAEVFLNDVRIPVENVVGAPNRGWAVTQVTLAAERGILVFEGLERQWHALMHFFKNAVDEGADWLEDDQLRREFMLLLGEVQANRHLVRQLLRENEEEGTRPSMTPALVKICFSASKQRVSEFMTRLDDLAGQLIYRDKDNADSTSMASYLDSYGHTIAGGSNEIMRNIIAERGLGMPR